MGEDIFARVERMKDPMAWRRAILKRSVDTLEEIGATLEEWLPLIPDPPLKITMAEARELAAEFPFAAEEIAAAFSLNLWAKDLIGSKLATAGYPKDRFPERIALRDARAHR